MVGLVVWNVGKLLYIVLWLMSKVVGKIAGIFHLVTQLIDLIIQTGVKSYQLLSAVVTFAFFIGVVLVSWVIQTNRMNLAELRELGTIFVERFWAMQLNLVVLVERMLANLHRMVNDL